CALAATWIGRAARSAASDGVPATPEPLAVAHVLLWTVLACISVRFVPLWALIVLPLLGEALVGFDPSAGPEAVSHPKRRPFSHLWLQGRLLQALARLSDRLAATDALVGKGLWSAMVTLALLVVIASGKGLPSAQQQRPDAHFDPRLFPVAAAQRL